MFKIIYHYLVVSEDISKISKSWRSKIRSVIGKKLTAKPDLYGKPLRRSLKGYYKLRVGDYRVVYKISGSEVKILAIKHRSVVYSKIVHRNFD